MRLLAFFSLLALSARADDPRGFLLQVEVGDQVLSSGATAHLVTPEGRSRDLTLLDDGIPPDIAAGDGVLTAGVPRFAGQQAQINITSGEQSWDGALTIDTSADKPVVRIQVGAEGITQQPGRANLPTNAAPGRNASLRDADIPPPTPGRAAPAPLNPTSRLQFIIWAGAVFAAGATAGAFGATFLPQKRSGRGSRRRR